jgi:hypothetical protein
MIQITEKEALTIYGWFKIMAGEVWISKEDFEVFEKIIPLLPERCKYSIQQFKKQYEEQ